MNVLITGAAGHLGRKLFDFLQSRPGFTVSGLDIRAVDHPRIHVADFAGEPVWADHFTNVDVIVHLAGDPEPNASWKSVIENNMDATLELYHHAAEKGVSRVVLTSSNWLQANKRFNLDKLNSDTPPGPINAYGMSKLFCERTAAYFAQYRGLSVICLRIGWSRKPGTQIAMGRWGQEMWLSDRDYLNGMLAAINAPDVTFAVLNLMSDNPGMRWDIDETKATIGYEPQDGNPPKVTTQMRLKSYVAKLITQSIPRWFARNFPEW